MKRVIFFILLITGLLTIIIGIAEAVIHPNRLPELHIVIGSIFTLTCIIHILINRKAVMRYIKGK